MAVTLVADLSWILFWAPLWRSDKVGDFERGIHGLVIFTSMIGFIIKVKKKGKLLFKIFVNIDYPHNFYVLQT